MGSLGARRLNAASDLDLIVIYDADGAEGSEGKKPLVSVRDLHGGTAAGVSFDVFPGEVVGLYGLVGSGRSSVGVISRGPPQPPRPLLTRTDLYSVMEMVPFVGR